MFDLIYIHLYSLYYSLHGSYTLPTYLGAIKKLAINKSKYYPWFYDAYFRFRCMLIPCSYISLKSNLHLEMEQFGILPKLCFC